MSKYGKDRPENFIEGALCGGSGESNEIVTKDIGRGQTLKSAYPMDNVKLAGPRLPNERGGKLGGGINDISHSLSGASVVSDPFAKDR